MILQKMKMLFGTMLLVTLFSATLFSQDAEVQIKAEDDFTSQLAVQLNLSEEQTEEVRVVLNDYKNSLSADASAEASVQAQLDANTKIEAILDETQLATWSSIQTNFWSNLNSSIATSEENEPEQY